MKVVYRSILKEIEKAVEMAMANGRSIEYVELSPVEFNEFKIELNEKLNGCCTATIANLGESMYMGVSVRRRT